MNLIPLHYNAKCGFDVDKIKPWEPEITPDHEPPLEIGIVKVQYPDLVIADDPILVVGFIYKAHHNVRCRCL